MHVISVVVTVYIVFYCMLDSEMRQLFMGLSINAFLVVVDSSRYFFRCAIHVSGRFVCCFLVSPWHWAMGHMSVTF